MSHRSAPPCDNLFAHPCPLASEELVSILVDSPQLRLERIVSHGHATPVGEWYDQSMDEWVVLLSGAAELEYEQGGEYFSITLVVGDYLHIPAHQRHRVVSTATGIDSVWLALHYLGEINKSGNEVAEQHDGQ